MLLPTQLWGFRAAFWAPKVTFQSFCSEAIMNYFTFYYMLSESKHFFFFFFMSQHAPLLKSNKDRQMQGLVWPGGSTARQMLPDRNSNQVTLWHRSLSFIPLTVLGSVADSSTGWALLRVTARGLRIGYSIKVLTWQLLDCSWHWMLPLKVITRLKRNITAIWTFLMPFC